MQKPYLQRTLFSIPCLREKMAQNKLKFEEKQRNLKKDEDQKCDIFYSQDIESCKASEFVLDFCLDEISLFVGRLSVLEILSSGFQRLIHCQ